MTTSMTHGGTITSSAKQLKCKWRGGAKFLRPAFKKLGALVGQHPIKTVVFSLGFTGFCSLGLLKLDTTIKYKIWADFTSPSYQHYYGRVLEVWPEEIGTTEILVHAPPGPDNPKGILAPECLAQVKQLRNHIASILPLAVCGRRNGDCEQSLFRALEISNISDHRAAEFLSQARGENGLPHNLSSIVGGACCGPQITQASALKVRFHSLLVSRSDTRNFDASFLNVCLNWVPYQASNASCPSLKRAMCQASNSFQWEEQRALMSDQRLLVIAIVLMLTYVAVSLGGVKNCVQSKVLLGTSVICAVVFSLVIGFGISSVLGFGFSQMSMMAIFILLGIGIDDAFIISNAFQRTDPSLHPKERLVQVLEEVGPAVLLTSATDIVAFMVGIQYKVQAIRWFCITSAIATFAMFLCQVTFFSALVVLDAQREQAQRYDIFPCLPMRRKQAQSDETGVGDQQGNKCSAAHADPDNHAQLAHPRATKWIARGLHPVALTVSLCGFAMLLASSFFLLSTKASKGSMWTDFLPADSYLVDYWHVNTQLFGSKSPVGVFADPISLNSAQQLQALHAGIHALRSLSSMPDQFTWVDAYLAWQVTQRSNESEQDPRLLQKFLHAPEGRSFVDDIVLVQGNQVMAKAWISFDIPSSAEAQLRLTQQIRTTFANAVQNDVSGFVWSRFFLDADRYETIDRAIFQSQILGLFAVGIVCFIMLPIHAASASLISIVLVNINIAGFISLWDVQMSVSTAAILVLAMGYSVDYAAHIAEGLSVRMPQYSESSRLKDLVKPVVGVLCTTGFSVLHGGISTFLAVLVLAFSNSKGFQDVFKCFLLMVIFGLLHGLVLLPMLFVLSLRLSICLKRWHKKLIAPCLSMVGRLNRNRQDPHKENGAASAAELPDTKPRKVNSNNLGNTLQVMENSDSPSTPFGNSFIGVI